MSKKTNATSVAAEQLPALVSVADLTPDALADYESQLVADAAEEFDNGFRSSNYTPTLRLLQSNSPELKPRNEKFVAGAAEGDVFNSATKEVLGRSVIVVPCYFDKGYHEWVPRHLGGGYKGRLNMTWDEYKALPQHAEKKSIRLLPNGNECVETAQVSCILVTPTENVEVRFDFKSSDLAVAREWNKRVGRHVVKLPTGSIKGRSYSYAYTASGKTESNSRGEEWYSWRFDVAGLVPPSVYSAAKDFAFACSVNAVTVDAVSHSKRADVAATLAEVDAEADDMPF